MIEHLRGILNQGAEAIETDERLLRRFVSDRDEDAFAVLVRRHGPMVLGVCLRTTRNREDAEDAFQATFLVLASKADSIKSQALLGHWLYGVAYNTARKARAIAVRRRLSEQQVEELPDIVRADQELQPELYGVLDEELNRLPEKHRAPIVLCYLEGKTQREAARDLGCPEKTLSSRLARARDVLAKRLARRALAVTGGSLAVVLPQTVSTAGVAPALVWSTIEAAHLFTVTPEVVSGKVTTLTQRVLKAMFLAKLRNGVIVAALAVLVTIGAVTTAGRMCAAGPPAGGVTAPSAASTNEQPVADEGKKPVARKGLDGTWLLVGAEENGKKKSFPDGAGILVGFQGDEIITVIQQMSLFGEGGTGSASKGKFKVVKPAGDRPAGIDLLFADPDAKPWKQGIYKLDGDVLTICWGGKDRPTEFTAKAGSGNRVNVFKRLGVDE